MSLSGMLTFGVLLPVLALMQLSTLVAADCSSLGSQQPFVGMQFTTSDACFTYLTQQVVGSPAGSTSQTCLQDYMICVAFSTFAAMSFASVPQQSLIVISSFGVAQAQFESQALCQAVSNESTFFSSGISSVGCSASGLMTIVASTQGTTSFVSRLSTSAAVVSTLVVT